eukprot:scaffold22766_cov131-Cylindrotheca_fusiformis.AAC.5
MPTVGRRDIVTMAHNQYVSQVLWKLPANLGKYLWQKSSCSSKWSTSQLISDAVRARTGSDQRRGSEKEDARLNEQEVERQSSFTLHRQNSDP